MSPVESTDLDGWSVFTGPWWWCHHRSVCWTLCYLAIQTSFLSTLWNLVQTFTQTQCHLSVFLTGKTHWKSRSETQTWLIVSVIQSVCGADQRLILLCLTSDVDANHVVCSSNQHSCANAEVHPNVSTNSDQGRLYLELCVTRSWEHKPLSKTKNKEESG